jgi:hypothetical protein
MRVRESQLRFPQEQQSHVESHPLLRILKRRHVTHAPACGEEGVRAGVVAAALGRGAVGGRRGRPGVPGALRAVVCVWYPSPGSSFLAPGRPDLVRVCYGQMGARGLSWLASSIAVLRGNRLLG